MPASIKLFERAVCFDPKLVRANHARLTELYARREPDLFMVSAHDPALFADAVTTSVQA